MLESLFCKKKLQEVSDDVLNAEYNRRQKIINDKNNKERLEKEIKKISFILSEIEKDPSLLDRWFPIEVYERGIFIRINDVSFMKSLLYRFGLRKFIGVTYTIN